MFHVATGMAHTGESSGGTEWGDWVSLNALVVDEVSMARYQVTFFKDLLSSCGTPVRCMQRGVEIQHAVGSGYVDRRVAKIASAKRKSR